MAEPLKNLINPDTARRTAEVLAAAWPDFPAKLFLDDILPQIETLELMQRGQLIANAMRNHLPADFPAAAHILKTTLPTQHQPGIGGWALLSYNQFVAQHGLLHMEIALDLLKALTPHFTAEFGIRSFIHQDQEKALSIISGWTGDPNHHVRRLASEGTRPRLPWAMRLPSLVRNPKPLIPLLETLLDDEEDYVRRSVANSLNDIAKDHPDLVADFVQRHAQGASKNRLWLLKHASRTLLKKGHVQALANFGFADADAVKAELALKTVQLDFPGTLEFSVTLTNASETPQSVMLDYAIHHQKKDGTLSAKMFKGKALVLKPGETVGLQRRHAFRPITTRVYYPGRHRIEIHVNGRSMAGTDFILAAPSAA